jgi:hypothetical protein
MINIPVRNEYRDCCWQNVKDVVAEINRRLTGGSHKTYIHLESWSSEMQDPIGWRDMRKTPHAWDVRDVRDVTTDLRSLIGDLESQSK